MHYKIRTRNSNKKSSLFAGAATSNITPVEPVFLYGYPFVERISKGVHDWLLSSALYLASDKNQVMLISNDVIFVSKASVSKIRKGIFQKTGILPENILISATHTHSGPVTVDYLSNSNDPVVPKANPDYIRYMEEKIIQAGCKAFQNAGPARAGFLIADGTGIGTNRHDPSGPAIMDIPVMIIKDKNDKYVCCMMVCSMHPTILHEDSRLISGDFPAFAREILQKKYFGCECPVIYFTGAAGNQSPRHVTKSNTFEEAKRIGGIVADAIGSKTNEGIKYSDEIPVQSTQKLSDLPKRKFPDPEWAQQHRNNALKRFENLKKSSKNLQEIRTAEVDWFGAEELLHLSKLAKSKDFEKIYKSCLPAEIQIIKINNWNFVGWQGEIFIEFALELKKHNKNIFLISLANGELQGYIATEEAEQKGYYEASNSVFHHSAGKILVKETISLIKTLN